MKSGSIWVHQLDSFLSRLFWFFRVLWNYVWILFWVFIFLHKNANGIFIDHIESVNLYTAFEWYCHPNDIAFPFMNMEYLSNYLDFFEQCFLSFHFNKLYASLVKLILLLFYYFSWFCRWNVFLDFLISFWIIHCYCIKYNWFFACWFCMLQGCWVY